MRTGILVFQAHTTQFVKDLMAANGVLDSCPAHSEIQIPKHRDFCSVFFIWGTGDSTL